MAQAKNRPDRTKGKRIPVGTQSKLTADNRPGFKRRFVNDEDGRVDMFLRAGYEIVNDVDTIGQPRVGDASNTGSRPYKSVGGGMNAVLMEIPEEFYNEDQAAKERRIADKSEGLLAGENGEKLDDNLTYGDGIKIKTNRPVISET